MWARNDTEGLDSSVENLKLLRAAGPRRETARHRQETTKKNRYLRLVSSESQAEAGFSATAGPSEENIRTFENQLCKNQTSRIKRQREAVQSMIRTSKSEPPPLVRRSLIVANAELSLNTLKKRRSLKERGAWRVSSVSSASIRGVAVTGRRSKCVVPVRLGLRGEGFGKAPVPSSR